MAVSYLKSLGLTKRSPIYQRWCAMRQRCNNTNHGSYEYYGGKGIYVCSEWSDFQTFYNWAMTHGYSNDLQIDRIDNDGPYSPSNCRFVTARQNTRNRSSFNRNITYKGKTQCLNAWDEELGFKKLTILQRLNKGWSIDKAIETPVGSQPHAKHYFYDGNEYTLLEIARIKNISVATLQGRLQRGWSIDRVLNEPVQTKYSNKKERRLHR